MSIPRQPSQTTRVASAAISQCGGPAASPRDTPEVPAYAGPVLVHSTTPVVPRDRLLRMPDVERAAGIKKSTVYQLMKEGKFPQCVRITRRLSVWPESAVLTWVNDRIREGGEQ